MSVWGTTWGTTWGNAWGGVSIVETTGVYLLRIDSGVIAWRITI